MAENFVHIHAPAPVEECCQVNLCPTCERPRRMFVQYFEWYGPSVTCAGCGEEWQHGYQCERPLMRGWRKKNIQYAIRNLERIGVKA